MSDRPLFVVAGGSRGIGRAIALEAARAGYTVLLTYVRNKAAAHGVIDEIGALGGDARAVQADTSRDADIQQVFAECDRWVGSMYSFITPASRDGGAAFIPTLPMQRAGDPAEVAAAVMFLVSSQASYITGANLAVSGGR